ncbi:hypothetical protein J6590_013423 [Homalodisca vitripennis]|nr:hypothetical protein J6590_013423 [Homalodisca vitripennis]
MKAFRQKKIRELMPLCQPEGSDIPCSPRFGDSGFVCVCNATYCDTFTYPSRSTENFTHIFTSNHTPGYNFLWGTVQNASTLPISLADQSITVNVNISNKSHRLKGIGGSFTDSFCINVKSLSEEAGNNLLRSYFSRSGNEYKMARVPIASSDFCTRTYTYDDTPGDVNLEYFKLAPEDYTYKIPVISAARQMSPHNLYLFGSPWTSPNWTKNDNSYTRGYMKEEYFGYWAKYLLRFLEEYRKEGIDFWGFSPFNEPINALYLKQYLINSMQWLPMAHRVFIRDHLGPLLRASPFNSTKLLTFEDGRWFLEYWLDRALGEVIVQLWAKVRKAPPPKLMLDSGKVKQVTMADTALRDLLPKLELLDQVPRLTQRKHLVDHATCQDPAYIFHGGQTDSISEGRHMIKAPQIENESNCRVLQSLNPIYVSPRDTVAVCRIAVIKYRQNKRTHKPELSGFWQQTSKSVQTPQPTKGTLDSMSDMIRKGELTVKHNSESLD